MTRILQVIGSMNMGGSETFLLNMLKYIDSNRFKFYFLCYGDERFDYEEQVEKLGGKIIRVRKPRKYFDFGMINIIKKVIEEYQIDIVHAHTYYNSMYGVIAAKQMNLGKIIIHSHNTKSEYTRSVLKKIYYRISRRIINRYATIFLACGNDAGKALFDAGNEFEVIENGICIDKYEYSSKIRNRKRQELGISNAMTALLHVGRFERQKNHEFLVEIFKVFHDKNRDSKLFLVGDGSLRDQIARKVKDFKLENNVVFLGKRDDVNELYSAMDVLIFPSLYEGSPVALVEAQASGIPIVASANIDKEIDSSGSIKFVPLGADVGVWDNAIDKQKSTRTTSPSNAFKEKYDARNSALKLERIYEGETVLAREPKMSIVIPVYNAEGQIKRCLDSIVNQTYENLDIIIVDDGSTDGTFGILSDYSKNDSRIILRKGAHRGPNAARKIGVKEASGEYIMFVDSDDYIAKDAVAKVVSYFKETNIDVVRFNIRRTDNDKIISPILANHEKKRMISQPKIQRLLFTTYGFNNLCSQAYKISLVKGPNIFKDNIRFGEDFLANIAIHKKTSDVLAVSDVLYYYCYNPVSTTRAMSVDRVRQNIADRIYASREAIGEIEKNNIFGRTEKNMMIVDQIAMACDAIAVVSTFSDYNKNDFIRDFHGVFSKNIFSITDVGELSCCIDKQNIFFRLRYSKMIKAILEANYDGIWNAIVARRCLRVIRRVHG